MMVVMRRVRHLVLLLQPNDADDLDWVYYYLLPSCLVFSFLDEEPVATKSWGTVDLIDSKVQAAKS